MSYQLGTTVGALYVVLSSYYAEHDKNLGITAVLSRLCKMIAGFIAASDGPKRIWCDLLRSSTSVVCRLEC